MVYPTSGSYTYVQTNSRSPLSPTLIQLIIPTFKPLRALLQSGFFFQSDYHFKPSNSFLFRCNFKPIFDPLSCFHYHIISYPSLNQLSFPPKAQRYLSYIIHPLKLFKAVFNPVFFPSNSIPTLNPSNHLHLNSI